MKCSHCGRRNKNNAIVCRNCGAALIPPTPQIVDDSEIKRSAETEASSVYAESGSYSMEEYKKSIRRRNRRIILWTLLTLLLVAAACYVIFFAGNRLGQYLPRSGGYRLLGEDGASVLYGANSACEGEAASASISIDGRTAAFLTDKGELTVCRSGKSLTGDVNVEDLLMADGGGLVVYRDSAGKLFAINAKKKDPAPASVCSEAVLPNYAVSCNGKYVVYNKAADGALYMRTLSSGKETKLSSTLVPISISDSGKTIYAYNEEDCSLYRLDRKGNSTFMRGGVGSDICTNYDHTEIAVSSEAANGNVKTFVFSGGKEYEVGAGALAPVMTVSMEPAERYAEGFRIRTCPVKSFEGRFFAGEGIYRYSSAGSEQISGLSVERALMSDDTKLLFCISEGALYRFDTAVLTSGERLAADCAEFAMAKNGSVVWNVSSEGKLTLLRLGIEKAVDEGASGVACSPNGREAVYLKEGNAYYARMSAPAKPRLLARADGAAIDGRGMYLLTDGSWQGVTRRGRLFSLADEK